MDTFLQDLRYAARTLIKNPGFAALTIACLALGIGVNSTIFSVVDTVAIRPLPFSDPDRLVSLRTTQLVNGIERGSVSFLDVRDWRARTHSFAEIGTSSGRSLTISDTGEPERFIGATVSWNMFPMIGIQPVLGRQIREDEDTPGGPRVVLLSYGVRDHESALQRQRHRSDQLHRHRGVPRARRIAGQLHSRTPCHRCRSDDRSEGRIRKHGGARDKRRDDRIVPCSS